MKGENKEISASSSGMYVVEGCCSGDLNYVDNLGESRNSYHHGEVQYQPQKSVELVEELLKA